MASQARTHAACLASVEVETNVTNLNTTSEARLLDGDDETPLAGNPITPKDRSDFRWLLVLIPAVFGTWGIFLWSIQ